MWWFVCCWILQRDPLEFSGVFSLCSSLLSIVCPANSSYIELPRLPYLSPQFKAFTELCLGSFYLNYGLQILSRQEVVAITGLTLFVYCFSGLTILFFLSRIYYLEKHCFMYFACGYLFILIFFTLVDGKYGLCFSIFTGNISGMLKCAAF